MQGAGVLEAASCCTTFLESVVERDWEAPVPGLEWTVRKAVSHAANAVLWYALNVWSSPSDDAAFELSVTADASKASIVLSLGLAAQVCAASIDAAPPERRGFHPVGPPDASGFAAMACDEMLVHTADAARGLGLEFSAEASLAAEVLGRLFPWHESGEDPWRTLLWANDRLSLPDREDQSGWTWHCRPLSEWDGSAPVLSESPR